MFTGDSVLTLAACSGTCGNLVTSPVQDGALGVELTEHSGGSMSLLSC